MATRLRRLLFGAPHLARVAPHLKPHARLRRFIGGSAPARWFTATVAGIADAGWLSAPRRPSTPSAPPAETVLVLIQDPDHDALSQLQFARTLGTDVRAVYVDGDPEQTRRLLAGWARTGDGVPLLILEGDGLPVAASLRAYVDLLARERATGQVSLVLPVCESGTCRAKIRCALGGTLARLVFGGRPGVRVMSGSLAPARTGRELAGCPAEA